MNIYMCVLCEHKVSTHFGCILLCMIDKSYGKTILNFLRNYQTVFQCKLYYFAFLPAMNEGTIYSTSLIEFGLLSDLLSLKSHLQF